MSRGNRKAIVFEDERDQCVFADIVTEASERYGVPVLAECRMGNHFHMVVLTPRGNLSAFMRHVDGVYTQYSNRRHQRVGHLFQGPFKSVIVENDIHLLAAVAYVLMNPVDAGLVQEPGQWKWSSYSATIGLAPLPPYLSLDWLDTLFPTASRNESQLQFHVFMSGSGTYESYLQHTTPAIGSAQFRQAIRSFIGESFHGADLPRSYKSVFRPSLEELFAEVESKKDRQQAIQRAHVIYGYKQAEISRALCLHPGSVSRLLCALRNEGRERVEAMLKKDT
jgi:REP element-mobilizing transposase RayT